MMHVVHCYQVFSLELPGYQDIALLYTIQHHLPLSYYHFDPLEAIVEFISRHRWVRLDQAAPVAASHNHQPKHLQNIHPRAVHYRRRSEHHGFNVTNGCDI